MTRILQGLAIAVLALFGVLTAAPATAAAGTTRDVDDFTFSSFEADYHLDRDAEGRSTMRVVETIVAEFPDRDQNRGIQRAIPSEYDGHPTDFRLLSVTDENGAAREYEHDSEDGFEILTIAGEEYVRGSQTYVIAYEAHNVTRFFADTDSDEFYRDVNGTAWAQPFDRVTARLHLGDELAARLTGAHACAVGAEGATASCPIDARTDGAETVIEASATGLGPEETVTIAVGFEPGTFTPRDDSLWASGFAAVLVAGLIAFMLAVGAAVLVRLTTARDARGRPTIVAEYLPPDEPELPVIAAVLNRGSRTVAATLISFAVRGIARIVEQGKKYELEYRGAGRPVTARAGAGLGEIEAAIAAAFFGKVLTPGERAALGEVDEKVGASITAAVSAATTRARRLGYLREYPARSIALVLLLSAIAAGLLFVAAIGLFADARAEPVGALALVLAVLTIVAAAFVIRRPLTASGAELRDHLRGMKKYLQLAEEDRLRMLQSEEGAERIGPAGERVVHLYERLLPYAVLLGVEKSWGEALGAAYEREGGSPDWYAGSGAFSTAAFAAGIGSFSAKTASHYSGSTTSSGSGGSTGGVSAGGGGGGGGGGGRVTSCVA